MTYTIRGVKRFPLTGEVNNVLAETESEKEAIKSACNLIFTGYWVRVYHSNNPGKVMVEFKPSHYGEAK